MSTDFKSINVLKLLPQQPPFIMVDKLLYFDQLTTITCLEVNQNNIFVDNGIFTSSGLIENIAQTCAVRMGYINQFIYKENVKLGFIGSIKNLEIHRNPIIGETLTTSIKIVEEEDSFWKLRKAKKKAFATAEMKIALSDIDSKVK